MTDYEGLNPIDVGTMLDAGGIRIRYEKYEVAYDNRRLPVSEVWLLRLSDGQVRVFTGFPNGANICTVRDALEDWDVIFECAEVQGVKWSNRPWLRGVYGPGPLDKKPEGQG